MFDSMFPSHWTTLRKLMWLKLKGASAVWSTISGNPVSFTAKAAPLRQLKVAFSPVQSLNGYDSPWPAGGGKNLAGFWQNAYVDSHGVIASTPTNAMIKPVFVPSGSKLSITKGTFTSVGLAVYSDAELTTMTYRNGGITTDTYTYNFTANSYAIVWFNLGSGTATQESIDTAKAQVEIGNVTTFAPYSNECPISGWSSLTVEQRGKNLLDQSSLTTTGITYSDGVLTGTAAAFNTAYGTSGNPIPISVGTSRLTISLEAYTDGNASATGGGLLFRLVNDDGTSTQAQLPNSTSEYAPLTVTSASGKTVVGLLISYGSDGQNIWHIRNLQLEIGSTASPYQPYNGRSISISLGQTVYSGYVDVVTGVGEITHKSVDMGSLSWVDYLQQNNAFYAQLPDAPNNTGEGNTPDVYCTIYAKTAAKSNAGWLIFTGNNAVSLGYDSARVYFRDTRFADVAAIGNSLDGVIFVYPLATPIHIQLTPQEVQSLAGDNTMWSNANQPITVTYRSN